VKRDDTKLEIDAAEDIAPVEVNMKTIDCPVERVTVYSDRAESTRKIFFDAKDKGPHNVVVSGFSTKLNPNTIRVSGKREVIIQEVSYAVLPPAYVPLTEIEVQKETERKDILTDKKMKLTQIKGTLEKDLESVKGEEKLLNQFSKHQLEPQLIGPSSDSGFRYLDLKEAETFMQSFRDHSLRLNKKNQYLIRKLKN